MSNIGIMGGTFDPVHNGHLLLGKQAYTEYNLDEIWYMPSGIPPHKTDHRITDTVYRVKMLELAIEPYPYFRYSDFEVKRNGNTYTADTLALLKEAYPCNTFYLIVGADSIFDIEKWYKPEKVMSSVTIMAAVREYDNAPRSFDEQIEYLSDKYGAHILKLHSEEVDISSAELRERSAAGKSISKYVPKKVEEYISRHNIYMSTKR